jgi:aryl-alcohol dehydrogenase-like predicted oxidoreductase
MGCARLGSAASRTADRAAEAAVERALESGITFFDTADCYGRGRSERILGKLVRRLRGEVVIATKCGLVRTPATMATALRSSPGLRRAAGTLTGLARERRGYRDYSAAYIERAAEASLRRLNTDYVDVLLLHSPPRSVLVEGSFADILERLRERGAIRAWGVSVRGNGDAAEDALAALRLPGLQCLELELNLCAAWASSSVLPFARERGVGVIARQPFGSGSLLRHPGTARYRTTVAACLQFPIRAAGVAVAIAGMTRPQHVSANVEAALGTVVADNEVARIRDLLC